MKQARVITIDGPAGVGKTSIAHALADKLKIQCLDTGGMFRFAALKLGPDALDWPEEQLVREMRKLHFEMEGTGNDTILICNGEAGGDQLRSESVGNLASKLASLPGVRKELRKAQQEMALNHALVAEGRDMGTVVFPHAPVKIYLDATPEIRAKRRFLQLREKGLNPNFEELLHNIQIRDERDKTRSVAPLIPAEDAHIIDTSEIDLPEVMNKIQNILQTSPLFRNQHI